jgi:glycosyltransferase involved in cell wall biosynthesis
MTNNIVFVADLFAEDYEGGAELTTAALIESSKMNVIKVKSSEVTVETLQKYQHDFWVFGNFAGLNFNLIPAIVGNINYCILEYDYKFCNYRSIEKHLAATGRECDCHDQLIGKYVSAFFYGADHLFWMSEQQRDRYHSRFSSLRDRPQTVLSSVFSQDFFNVVTLLKSGNSDRQGWIVLGSDSWIKGREQAIKWCKENNKSYEIVWDIPYHDLLSKLASAEGFVYLPLGGDTCPRMVIEAKLLGCEVIVNGNVQHSTENWWQRSPDDVCDYLKDRPRVFWSIVEKYARRNLSVSGYTTTYNCISQNYPFVESITSMLDCLDEVVVVDGGSFDGTLDVLNDMARENSKLKVVSNLVDWNHKRSAVFDGSQKALARSHCTGDICWQQDVDEIIHDNDYAKIRALVRSMHKSHQLIALPVIEFWGKQGNVRIDINPWKWRISKNYPHITHGIPGQLRQKDENGDVYSLPGSDGCDYVHADTGDLIPFSNFHTQETENLRLQAQTDPKAREEYVKWFTAVTSSLPGVYHYSWFDLPRKIKTYRGFWSRHWQSLFNVAQEDSPQNNMFFDKKWEDVTDDEINALATRLESEMGGWIFHRKIDWNKPTPRVMIEGLKHPDVMQEWIGGN